MRIDLLILRILLSLIGIAIFVALSILGWYITILIIKALKKVY